MTEFLREAGLFCLGSPGSWELEDADWASDGGGLGGWWSWTWGWWSWIWGRWWRICFPSRKWESIRSLLYKVIPLIYKWFSKLNFLLLTKHTWNGGLMHLFLCSFILLGLPLTFSMQTLQLNCCWRRGFAKFYGVLIVSKAFMIGSSFLPDEYLLPPAMFLWSNWA